MKKVLLGVVGVVVVGVVGFLGVAASRPDTSHVERSLVVQATPVDVFPLINDLKSFADWNPWREMDPAQKTTFSEPSSGKGAWYTWEGNKDVGKGKLSITESVENVKVVEQLEFIEPFESKAVVTMSLAPSGDGTKVTWAMDSEQNLMSKVMGLLMDMDAMLGADFEKGLKKVQPLAEANAKTRLEAEAAAKAAAEAAAAAVATADGAVAAPPTP